MVRWKIMEEDKRKQIKDERKGKGKGKKAKNRDTCSDELHLIY